MAYSHGIANGHDDLYAKLLAFLTTDPALVALNQQWDIVWESSGLVNPQNPTDKLLRGPGLAGQDQVYVGIRSVALPAQDQHWFAFRGATGPMATATNYGDHIKSSGSVRMFTDSGTMEYWMVANGRRFAMVVKISTVFESMYAGLFLPYATPLAYPYPLYIGGSAGPEGMSNSVSNWRSESQYHTQFIAPNATISVSTVESGVWLLDPMGQWIRAGTTGTDNNIMLHPRAPAVSWWGSRGISTGDWSAGLIEANMVDAYGGGRLLTPYTLTQLNPSLQTYGILDGVFSVAGVANQAENIIQQDGVDHLVVQNVFRSTFYDYWALALE